jgi:hypothetical protein
VKTTIEVCADEHEIPPISTAIQQTWLTQHPHQQEAHPHVVDLVIVVVVTAVVAEVVDVVRDEKRDRTEIRGNGADVE